MTATAPEDATRRRRWFRPVVAAGAVVAVLLVLEAGLRILHGVRGTYEPAAEALRVRANSPWTGSDDPELVYVHRPRKFAAGEMKTESHGILRPQEVRTAKPPGTQRLAVVGDSVGAAIGLRYGERLPDRLEKRLASGDGAGVEVLNFCVNGYATVQEARLLETAVAPLSPDAVLVVYCLNDPAESVTPIAWFRDPEPPASYAADLVGDGIAKLTGRPRGRIPAPGVGPDEEVARRYWNWLYEPDGEHWRRVLAGFDRIADWSRERRVPVLFAIAPLLLRDDPAGASTLGYRTQVADALRARGLACVDLQPVVSGVSLKRLQSAGDDIYHASSAGHEAFAAALLPDVRKLLGR